MHKDELLQLHSLLCQMKRFFEDSGLDTSGFDAYEDLQVSPQHIHKSKTDHKKAVFMLGRGLTDIVLVANPENRARMRERFARLASTVADEAPETPERKERTEHLPAFALAALSS